MTDDRVTVITGFLKPSLAVLPLSIRIDRPRPTYSPVLIPDRLDDNDENDLARFCSLVIYPPSIFGHGVIWHTWCSIALAPRFQDT